MAIYQADTRCKHCKNWATVYLSAEELPSTQIRFCFTCQCHRRVEGADATFTEVRAMPVGGVVCEAISA